MQSSLKWRRGDRGWQLFNNRQRMGRLVPDTQHPGMWRSIKPGGRLSGMANLSHAKNAVLVEAERELEFEARQRRAIHPQKSQQKGGVFEGTASPVSKTLAGALS
ncbi:MAG: hypothetical protein ACLQF4_13280 [Xanthobacteraceae bacterium]